VYTVKDYADIIDSLVQHWNIERLWGLSDLAAKSQDYLCGLATRYRSLAERVSLTGSDRFSWIFDRQVG
jgi:acyl-[acyl-carrier-protein] desaturase